MIARDDANGVVTARGNGTTTITASAGSVSASVTVTVSQVPSGPSLPPPPPAPPPDAPAASTRADGVWRSANQAEGGSPEEWVELFMYDGLMIASRSHAWPSTHLMAAGVYQISGETITAQFTSMRSGFPDSGFSGTVVQGSDDGQERVLDLEFITNEGTVRSELIRGRPDRVIFEELIGVWNNGFLEPEYGISLTLHSDGSLFYQDNTSCTASGNFSLHDMEVLVLSFDMSGCGIAVRNGAYRALGFSSGRDGGDFRQTLSIVAANDTSPGQFFAWWVST